jgi:hypothetical protein
MHTLKCSKCGSETIVGYSNIKKLSCNCGSIKLPLAAYNPVDITDHTEAILLLNMALYVTKHRLLTVTNPEHDEVFKEIEAYLNRGRT